MRILVTNDDGIDSVGLHKLALAIRHLGEVVVVAPDTEFSGAGCAVGAFNKLNPEVHRVRLEGIDEAWTVSGPPALCVIFARAGIFEKEFDLVVSGINPGANVGRAVYHSGTVGACITARNSGITGIAVSQDAAFGSVVGQAWDEMLLGMKWDTAAHVAAQAVGAIVANPPATPQVLNINVPNAEVSELKGWRRTEMANQSGRTSSQVALVPKIGHEDAFNVRMDWGQPMELPEHTDIGTVQRGFVSVTWLSAILPVHPGDDDHAEQAIDRLFRI